MPSRLPRIPVRARSSDPLPPRSNQHLRACLSASASPAVDPQRRLPEVRLRHFISPLHLHYRLLTLGNIGVLGCPTLTCQGSMSCSIYLRTLCSMPIGGSCIAAPML